MTFFFLVVGLEARREIDLGDLRDREPVPAAGRGRAVRDGRPGRALPRRQRRGRRGRRLGRRDVDRHRARARAAGDGRARRPRPGPHVPADRLRRRRPRGAAGDRGDVHRAPPPRLPRSSRCCSSSRSWWSSASASAAPRCSSCGVAIWFSVLASGVDPVVTGLVIGLTAAAYTPARGDLEEASGLFRQFREEPTPDLARTAAVGLTRTLSPNDRLQRFYHPWTQLCDRAAVRAGERRRRRSTPRSCDGR